LQEKCIFSYKLSMVALIDRITDETYTSRLAFSKASHEVSGRFNNKSINDLSIGGAQQSGSRQVGIALEADSFSNRIQNLIDQGASQKIRRLLEEASHDTEDNALNEFISAEERRLQLREPPKTTSESFHVAAQVNDNPLTANQKPQAHNNLEPPPGFTPSLN